MLFFAFGLLLERSSATSFITLGDWGGFDLGSYHTPAVKAVARQMQATAKDGIQFLVNTGDNFYYCGIQNATDPQIATDFTGPYGQYSELNVPWYSILGNHEYGYNVEAQIEMAQQSLTPPWVMDDRYYTKRVALGGGSAHVSFIFIDTSPCMSAYRANDPSGWDPCGKEFPTCSPIEEGPCKFHENILSQSCTTQFTWFKKALAAVPKDDWLIVVGHAPADEIDVEDFTGEMQRHGFDLYLNGHVHTLTHYSLDGKAAYVTSGAGAMVATQDQKTEVAQIKSSGGHLNQTSSNHAYTTVWNQKVAGFTHHTFSSDYTQLATDFISYEGNTLHSFTVTKGAPSPPSPKPGPSSCGGAGAYPCTAGCTYVHAANEQACGVAHYGCYACSALKSGCPDCESTVED